MTKIEACTLLDVSRSAGKAEAEQAFSEKHRELTRKLRPGNLPAVRQKTQIDIAMLMTARDTFCQLTSSPKPYSQKPHQRKTQKPKPQKAKSPAAATNPPKPQTLAEACDVFLTMMPFPLPKPVVVIVLLFMLIILLAILRACFLPIVIFVLLLIPLWALFKLLSK